MRYMERRRTKAREKNAALESYRLSIVQDAAVRLLEQADQARRVKIRAAAVREVALTQAKLQLAAKYAHRWLSIVRSRRLHRRQQYARPGMSSLAVPRALESTFGVPVARVGRRTVPRCPTSIPVNHDAPYFAPTSISLEPPPAQEGLPSRPVRRRTAPRRPFELLVGHLSDGHPLPPHQGSSALQTQSNDPMLLNEVAAIEHQLAEFMKFKEQCRAACASDKEQPEEARAKYRKWKASAEPRIRELQSRIDVLMRQQQQQQQQRVEQLRPWV